MSLPFSRPKEQEVTDKVVLQPLVKKILWPSTEETYSCKKFPSEHQIKKRKEMTKYYDKRKKAKVYALYDFVIAVKEANERLWIIDLYFATNVNGIASILSAVGSSNVKQIRILSGDKIKENPCYRDHWLLQLKEARSKKAEDRVLGDVQWKIGLSNEKYPYLHDRFAIVDQELWHFGATVGGGHPSLNAVSRGWDAEKTGAIAFFENVWNKPNWY